MLRVILMKNEASLQFGLHVIAFSIGIQLYNASK
jgi:hypothetical protein